MKEGLYCQSCGMPLGEHLEESGHELDGTKSDEYCKYCYEAGAFTSECTLEEMIAFCLPFQVEAFPHQSKEETLKQMRTYFPTLKRWHKV